MEAAGITLVCASGNEGTADTGEITEVPGDYDSTIGVVGGGFGKQPGVFFQL